MEICYEALRKKIFLMLTVFLYVHLKYGLNSLFTNSVEELTSFSKRSINLRTNQVDDKILFSSATINYKMSRNAWNLIISEWKNRD